MASGNHYAKKSTSTCKRGSPAEAGLLCVVTLVTNEEVNVKYL
ncbi:hypothetical protein [Bacillus toyonensis]|nr:hypothetical protein [Bacillus toyonensis]